MNIILVTDGVGLYGSLLHYALVLFFVGSALMVFTYLWWTGKLGMSEEPKYTMMKDDDPDKQEKKNGNRK